MADGTKGGKSKGDDRTPTRRMVLRKVRMLAIPEGADEAIVTNAAKTLRSRPADAWVECGEFTGSKVHAIEQHAGKPGTPDAIAGEFKAPPASGFAGGVVQERPPEPLVTRRVVK